MAALIPGFSAFFRKGRCQKRENSAFTVVIRAEDDSDVLDRDQEDEAPENKGDKAVDIRWGCAVPQTFFKCVQRAGSDVAEHHTQRDERQRK